MNEQRELAAIIQGHAEPPAANWQGSARLDPQTATGIYRRNYEGGVSHHLRLHFPVVAAYLGDTAFRKTVQQYLREQPPRSPIFTIYAAHYPGHLLGLNDPAQALWCVAGRLGAIDFFAANTYTDGQTIEVPTDAYHLWLSLRTCLDKDAAISPDGLYSLAKFHPEAWQIDDSVRSVLASKWRNGSLVFTDEHAHGSHTFDDLGETKP